MASLQSVRSLHGDLRLCGVRTIVTIGICKEEFFRASAQEKRRGNFDRGVFGESWIRWRFEHSEGEAQGSVGPLKLHAGLAAAEFLAEDGLNEFLL
jgi:hypothetical protein